MMMSSNSLPRAHASDTPWSHLHTRKGARRRSEIPPEVLEGLQAGQLSTVNLVEWLAVDVHALAGEVLPRLGLAEALPEIARARAELPPNAGVTLRHRSVAEGLYRHLNMRPAEQAARGWQQIATHPADCVREWAATAVGLAPDQPVSERLAQIRPFAADMHFGVREMAWMAVRPALAETLDTAVAQLLPWTAEADPNLRRFAAEVLRPRGVWCRHIEVLKHEPERGLPLLEPLRADPEKYVQDSVANWLNDAAKTRPDFVEVVCNRWNTESAQPATRRIVKRARRSLPPAS